jgi:peptide chain release factor 1
MLEQLEKIEKRYSELEHLLASYDAISDKEQYNKYAKELSDLKRPVSLFREFKKASEEIKGLEKVLTEKHDEEFIQLAKGELADLKQKTVDLQEQLKRILAGEDNELGKNIIVEIRQGTGGMEAGIFAADLYRMYTKYAARKNWSVESMSASPTELGGFKEIVFSMKGKDAYKRLKFESGVHRVQRVPTTEAQGRIHTSTATVAVLIEPEEVDWAIEAKDLRIDTYRSSGAGGQNVQKTDSAVRITHMPTGLVVTCQDERSQLKNKSKAMRVLRARLSDIKEQEESKKISQERKSQIGSGDRSEKIRTYNFSDRRVTDHRINFTSHQLEAILEGDLDELSVALIKAQEAKRNEPRPS